MVVKKKSLNGLLYGLDIYYMERCLITSESCKSNDVRKRIIVRFKQEVSLIVSSKCVKVRNKKTGSLEF